MNNTAIFVFLVASALLMAAPEAPPVKAAEAGAAPAVRRVKSLSECPVAVQAALKRDGYEAAVTEIRRIEANGLVVWAFETGSEEGGRDQETNVFYREDGTLERTETDIALKDAPEAVRKKLGELAGSTAVVDDVEQVKEGDRITYKAELESNGDVDRKVVLSAEGEVLSLAEEVDD